MRIPLCSRSLTEQIGSSEAKRTSVDSFVSFPPKYFNAKLSDDELVCNALGVFAVMTTRVLEDVVVGDESLTGGVVTEETAATGTVDKSGVGGSER